MKGHKHSEETKRQMSRSHTGIKFSDERKAIMSAAAKRREARRRREDAELRARLAEYEQRETSL
jgi:NUMOD3 motif